MDATRSKLSPTTRMLPPRGCRGVLTDWPRLLGALGRITSEPARSAQFAEAPAFGSPATVRAALSVNPAFLQGPQPPAEIYPRFIWFAMRLESTARIMEATLAQLSSIASDPRGLGPGEVGALAGETIAGEGGLSRLAGSLAVEADAFARHVSALEGPLGLDQALAELSAAGAELERHASAAAEKPTRGLAHLQSATAAAARRTREALDGLEMGAATVSAAAVVANLTAALRAMAEQCGIVRVNMEEAAASAAAGQAGDLRQSLGIDEAVASWKFLADATQGFVRNSLVTGK